MERYVGIIYKSGKIGALKYRGHRVGAVNCDLSNDPNIEDFLPGFKTEAGALQWAENNRK